MQPGLAMRGNLPYRRYSSPPPASPYRRPGPGPVGRTVDITDLRPTKGHAYRRDFYYQARQRDQRLAALDCLVSCRRTQWRVVCAAQLRARLGHQHARPGLYRQYSWGTARSAPAHSIMSLSPTSTADPRPAARHRTAHPRLRIGRLQLLAAERRLPRLPRPAGADEPRGAGPAARLRRWAAAVSLVVAAAFGRDHRLHFCSLRLLAACGWRHAGQQRLASWPPTALMVQSSPSTPSTSHRGAGPGGTTATTSRI